MSKRKTVGADEVDAFSALRHAHNWKAGQRKRIKVAVNRRERHQMHRALYLEIRPNFVA